MFDLGIFLSKIYPLSEFSLLKRCIRSESSQDIRDTHKSDLRLQVQFTLAQTALRQIAKFTSLHFSILLGCHFVKWFIKYD